MSAVLLFDGSTLFALAEAEVIVLREAVDAVRGILAHEGSKAILADFQHIGVRQTELSIVRRTLAIAQGEVFGMCLVELLDRDEMAHRVSAPIGFDVAIVVDVGAPFHIFARVSAPFGVVCHKIVAVAVADERFF